MTQAPPGPQDDEKASPAVPLSAQERRLQQLRDRLARVVAQRDAMQLELRDARVARRAAEQRGVELERLLGSAEANLQRRTDSLQRRTESLERLQSENELIRREREQIQSALRESREARAGQSQEQRQLRESLHQSRRQIAALSADMASSRSAMAFASDIATGRSVVEACAAYTRAQIKGGDRQVARAFAHALMYEPAMRPIGALCSALHAHADGFLPLARHLFAQTDPAWVDMHGLVERLDAEFDHDVGAGRAWFEAWWSRLAGRPAESVGSDLSDVATVLLAHGALDLAKLVAQRLTASRADWSQATAHWVARLAEIASVRREAGPASAGLNEPAPVRLALLDYKTLDRDRASANLGDYVQTLASLSNIVRFANVRFASPIPGLAAGVQGLAERLAPAWRLDSPSAQVELSLVDRDLASAHSPAEPTWMLAFGWYMHPNFKRFYDFPFPDHLCPIFISFHVNDRSMLTDEAVGYLQRWAPIGCRDWTTVYLLRERGVEAFFSGCLTTTVGKLFGSDNAPSGQAGPLPDDARVALVDYRDREGDFSHCQVTALSHAGLEVRDRTFLENLQDSVAALDNYQTFDKVITSRLHCYLPCRAIGVPVEFRPRSLSDIRFEGLVELDDDEFNAIRIRIEKRIADVLGLVFSGHSVEAVRQAWRDMCRDDVVAADAYCSRDIALEPATFDAAAAAQALRRDAARFGVARDASEGVIEAAFAVDHHLAEQLPVVLESLIQSTPGPVHVHVMTRGLGPDYGQRLGREFGHLLTLTLYDFDDVAYGDSLKMLAHTTVSTMDRLLLPDLLPHLDRVIYLDVDILLRGDLAALWSLELGDRTLAGKSSTDEAWRCGHNMVYRAARQLPRDKACRLRRSMHAAGTLDFPAFNAGVVVMNLARMRRDGFASFAMPLITHYGMNDQDVLNVYARFDRLELDIAWNAMPSRDVTDEAKLLHFAGPIKPWSGLYILRRELFEACRQAYLARTRAMAST